MKTSNTVMTAKPITQAAFFALPEILAQQAIQKRTRYGSAAHRAAHDEMVRIADGYLTQGRNELVRCSVMFGDY